MLDEIKQRDIWKFIRDEAIRIEYGKLYVELSVVGTEITDIEVETKKRKNFNKKWVEDNNCG